MSESEPLTVDREQLERLAQVFQGIPRVAYAGAHVYPAAAPDFTPAPRTVRPHVSHSQLRLYVHIPFCRYKCSYCYYAVKVTDDRACMDRYVQALLQELKWIEPGTPLRQVFVGGGTPTCLPADQLAQVLDTVFERTTPHGDHLHVVETSPETITVEHAEMLRDRGIGRVSMGIQTLEPPVLQTVQRGHSNAAPLDAMKLILDHDFVLNVDLIYGLPGQTEASFRQDLQRVIEAGAHSITAYDLRVTRSTPVVRRLREDEWLSIQRLMRWRTFVKRTAAEFGFSQTRWHTFQRLNGPAPKYWRAASHTKSSLGHQFGVGLSARSHLGSVVYRNHRSFENYVNRIESGQSPVEDLIELDDTDRKVQHIARSLGDGHPLDTAVYKACFNTTLEQDFGHVLESLTDVGAIERNDSCYTLTELGKLLHDLVTVAFYPPRAQQWLKKQQPIDSKAG